MTGDRPVALVTGASRGLGAAVARRLRAEGFDLILTARDASQLARVRAGLLEQPGGCVSCVAADLGDAEAPQAIATRVAAIAPRLTAVINNAAEQAPIGALTACDWSAWERAIRVDFLAPVALTRACVPSLRTDGRRAKVIFISGGGATSPRPNFSAYAAAKCALVRTSETLAIELAPAGIDVNAVAPGAMPSFMTQAVIDAGPERAGQREYDLAVGTLRGGRETIDRAAALVAYLVSTAGDGLTGRLISAVWDPWETLATRREALAKSDVYTLRRIVPGDRGLPE